MTTDVQEKLNKTIIEGLEQTWLLQNPTYALKFSKAFKEMGFKRVLLGSLGNAIRDDSIFEDITLMIAPHTSESFTSRTFYFESYPELYDLFQQGGSLATYFYQVGTSEEVEKLSVVIDGTNKTIGLYIPSRNLGVFFFDFVQVDSNVPFEKNKICQYFLEKYKDCMSKIKIKKKNIKDAVLNLAVNNFLREIEANRNRIIMETETNENQAREYNTIVVNLLKKNEDNRKLLETYSQLGGDIKGFIIKKIKEIKELSMVEKVSLTSEGINVKYKGVISINYKGKKIPMSEYTLIITPNQLTIKAYTPAGRDGTIYHHIHVKGNNICYGDSREKVNYMLSKREYKKIVLFMYLFLQEVNMESPYISVKEFIRYRDIKLKKRSPEQQILKELNEWFSDDGDKSYLEGRFISANEGDN